MVSDVQDLNRQGFKFGDTYSKDRFRPAVEKLRNVQFRDGSLYSNLRIFLPVPVLGVVWLLAIHWSTTPAPTILDRSMTVRHLLLATGITALWNLWLSLSLYTRRSAKSDLLAEVLRVTAVSFVCGLLPLAANLARGMAGPGILIAGLTTSGLLLASYSLLGCFLVAALLSSRLALPRVALIVGTGRRAAALRARLQSEYSRFQIFGCVDDEYHGPEDLRDGYLGPLDSLAELLKTHPIEVVLIGLPIKSKYDEIQRVIEVCETIGVESHYMQDLFETSRSRIEAHSLRSLQPHHFAVHGQLRNDPKQYLKRILDLLLGSALLILFAPLMIVVATAIRLTSQGPVFFVQQRYGRHRKRFPMFKFRSMVIDAEQRQAALEADNEAQGPVFKLRSDPRVTRIGAFLRRTSIDELPQLFNVLRGEMSLVGPRPLPLRDVSRFEETWLLRRFSVRPGLTCLWQVNGRSNTSFDFWIEQDLKYIDHWSLLLDFKILVLTIPAVLRARGAV